MRQRIPLPNAFSLLILVLLAATYFGVFGDLDWSWQVRTGAKIVETGSPRVPDSFSYTIHGQAVRDFEWLYEVLLWGVWSVFGLGGLKFLKVIVVVTPLLLVAGQLRREGVRWHGISLAMITAVFVLSSAWNLRPLYCTTIGLLYVSTRLHNHCMGIHPLSWGGIPLAMLLWANLHPGVITGQGLLLGALAWEWLNQWLRWNKPLSRSSLMRLTWVGSLGVLATFASPAPLERLRYPFQPELAHPIFRIFQEMQPLYAFFGAAPGQIAVIYLVAGLVLITIGWRCWQYRLWELILFAGLAVLANVAFRSVMDWFLVMLALAAPRLRDLLVQAAHLRPRPGWANGLLRIDRKAKEMLGSPWFRWQPQWLWMGMACLLALSVFPPLSRRMPRQNADHWPAAALDHVEQIGLCGRFFAPPDYGAYIGWRLGERAQVYIDTRGFFFPPVLIEDSHYLPQLGPDWRARLNRVLNQYHTDYFLLETTGARGALWQAVKNQIGEPLFLDDQSVLLSAEQVRHGAGLIAD